MFLERIVEMKRQEIRQLEGSLQEKERERVHQLPAVCSLANALKEKMGHPGLIAEVKPASPSKGDIRPEVDVTATAQGYAEGGAKAISVLTERTFFKGNLQNLQKVKASVQVPVLRKDFILEPVQLTESRLAGADAVLLIAALFSEEKLCSLVQEAHQLGLEVLLEVHEEDEIHRAVAANPDILGINNRNLHTFVTDLEVTERLRPLIPKRFPVIGESGVHSRKDFERLAQAGVDGVLVGEYLMRQASPYRAVRSLTAEVGL
ncbi:indole-3-glycerol phosphate synthase TrpC [Melghirimyces algeriensis]|uniref:Indole-3-glycerol phosphate synthase n=1 Tax=Melghirimyces algeriensis TaxID=910412 RepID=A0A521B6J0_9BACL|nr:indole-3-glycerol phosphate synthase TrpC [Melghirimyces algeriensis]SMO42714.1 indole-3-glycerol phosphate synthase [Melghirimyces algeriensis]